MSHSSVIHIYIYSYSLLFIFIFIHIHSSSYTSVPHIRGLQRHNTNHGIRHEMTSPAGGQKYQSFSRTRSVLSLNVTLTPHSWLTVSVEHRAKLPACCPRRVERLSVFLSACQRVRQSFICVN